MKIRIAVAVTPDGEWNSAGWGSSDREVSDADKMGICLDTLSSGEARYWVEAEVEIPQVKTVKGEVR